MSDQPLANKVAVITGGSRGLGRAMAIALRRPRAQIALVARDVAALEESARLVAEAGSTARCFAADVTDETQVAAMAEAVLGAFGGVDILINNAGINIRKNVHKSLRSTNGTR
jgi:NAD(P)-dependent dehydrogenase (short-subunit alcohol dehydrogenase family)